MHDTALCSSAQAPLYDLGDLVVIASETDDGLLADYGYISGIELDPPHCLLGGWWYSVRIVAGKCQGFQEWAPERDIQGQVIHGKQKRERAIRFEVSHRAIGEVNPCYRAGLG